MFIYSLFFFMHILTPTTQCKNWHIDTSHNTLVTQITTWFWTITSCSSFYSRRRQKTAKTKKHPAWCLSSIFCSLDTAIWRCSSMRSKILSISLSWKTWPLLLYGGMICCDYESWEVKRPMQIHNYGGLWSMVILLWLLWHSCLEEFYTTLLQNWWEES